MSEDLMQELEEMLGLEEEKPKKEEVKVEKKEKTPEILKLEETEVKEEPKISTETILEPIIKIEEEKPAKIIEQEVVKIEEPVELPNPKEQKPVAVQVTVPQPEPITVTPKVEEEPTYEFTFEEEETAPVKEVYLIFGRKGEGKTTLAMSFPGEIVVLSFDRKSAIIKATRYNNDPRIHVFDVTKYMDSSSPSTVVKSAEKTFIYLDKLLDYVGEKIKPDWIVIDGAELFQQICEFTMRARHGLEAFQGISNLNLWKERRLYIRQIHNKALNIAKRGIIYTTYVGVEERVVQGDVVDRREVPKWIDVIKYETDYVLRVEYDELNKRFRVRVIGSKNEAKFPMSAIYDVTNKSLWDYVKTR
jgi:hypothetical protein